MKRAIACASIAVVGAASLHAQLADSPAVNKPWSVSAKLRGFYDDNYNTAPSDRNPAVPTYRPESSWGVQFTPSVAYNLMRDLTTFNAKYTFDMRWYEARVDEEIDMTHVGEIGFSHTFSERVKVDLYDSLVYSSEPEVLDPSGMPGVYTRTENNNFRNYGGIGFNFGLTEKLGSRLGYSNTIYDYEEDNGDVALGAGSRSSVLDRMEHLVSLDLRWMFQPTLVGLVGYQFGYIDYTSDDIIIPATTLTGDIRDQESNYGFVGLDYTATPQLAAQLRAGFNYAQYPNANADDIWAPYVDAALSYEYLQGSKFVIGARHDLRPTDVANIDAANQVTMAQEATTLYAMINHRLTEKLSASLRGSYQMGEFQNGPQDGEQDDYYTVDVNLAYDFTHNLGVEVGYAYDNLDSDLDYRSFDRNRFYFGVKANY
ncbi:MAG TPA: outer membrane beta-barrel protein [Verrucomicrobiota bacterium]|nr:outer membrane beta-barrel protein [Verrucomicrobiota bacterium]HNU51934.1 outer membrane beta-barrel protein [Verrucomicrobiota bacterium]